MRIVQIPNGGFAENCYVVLDETARECAIVDPGEEAGLILQKVRETGAAPVAIWLTHAHVDHVVGVTTVAAETGAPIWLHPADDGIVVPERARAGEDVTAIAGNCATVHVVAATPCGMRRDIRLEVCV